MPIKPLTDFQKLILEDIISGDPTFKELAKKYDCSIALIQAQMRNICNKFGVNNWGMHGARRLQTMEVIREASINDSNR